MIPQPPPPHYTPLEQTINQIGDIAIFCGLPFLFAFVGLYLFRSPWRENVAGRALMLFSGSLALLYFLAAANSLFGTMWAFRPWIRLFVYTSVSISCARMLFVLIRLQSLRLSVEAPPEQGRGLSREERVQTPSHVRGGDQQADITRPPRRG